MTGREPEAHASGSLCLADAPRQRRHRAAEGAGFCFFNTLHFPNSALFLTFGQWFNLITYL